MECNKKKRSSEMKGLKRYVIVAEGQGSDITALVPSLHCVHLHKKLWQGVQLFPYLVFKPPLLRFFSHVLTTLYISLFILSKRAA